MSDTPHLLDELKAVLDPHARKTGESIEQFFNRQLHERIVNDRLAKPLGNVRSLQLSYEEINVIEESWSNAQLSAFTQWHQIKVPARSDVPLIVFRGWGKLCLIDGQKRINMWTSTRNDGPHRILIVEPKSDVRDPFKK